MSDISNEAGGVWARASSTISIDCELERMFQFVCDPKNDPMWMPKLGPGRQVTAGPIGAGTRFRQSITFLGGRTDVEWEITEFAVCRRALGASISGPLIFKGGYEFEQGGSFVRLKKFGKVRLPRMFSTMSLSIVDGILADEFNTSLGRLKLILEKR